MNGLLFLWDIVDKIIARSADIVGGIFNVIWTFLCSIIYGLIVVIFNIFNSLTRIDILTTDQVNGIYQRVTMIITIVMVFYITFEFIKYVVSPETFTDKEKGAGKIVMRIVIAILLIAFLPTIFTTAMKLQNRILDTNVISKVVFGVEDYDYKSAGSNFAGDVFKAFYRVNYDNCNGASCTEAEKKVNGVIESWKKDQGLWALAKANANDWIDLDNTIQFDGLLAVAFGAFALYVLVLYCIDVAVRYIQLIFLQIIAPIAAISYILPQKDGMLKKWTKQVTTTYLDIFIRIAVLYFMLLIISILANSFDFYELTSSGKQINIFVYIFIIAGLLVFVQRVPKLLEEYFPKGGAASIGFGFSGKDRFEPIGKTIGAVSKPIASVGSLMADTFRNVKSLKNGELKNKLLSKEEQKKGGLYRGATYAKSMLTSGYNAAKAGYKSGRFSAGGLAGQQAMQADEATVNKGGSVLGKTFMGNKYQNALANYKVKIENVETGIKVKGNITAEADEVKAVKQAKAAWESAKNGGASETEIESLRKIYKERQSAVINGTINTDGNAVYVKDGKTIIVKMDSEDKIRYNAAQDESNKLKQMIDTGYISDIINMVDKNQELKVPIERVINGKVEKVDVLLKDIKEEELKKNLGAVETALKDAIRQVKNSNEYQAAEANASESKK